MKDIFLLSKDTLNWTDVVKSGSKDIYNVTKDFVFKYMLFYSF